MVNYPPEFCPYCGTALESVEVEETRRSFCPEEERIIWHNPVPCAGVAVVEDEAVLLVERAAPPGVGE